MCDFGYLALCVEDHFMGSSPAMHVRRLEKALGLRGIPLEPSGPLAALTAGAHVIRAYFSGACACDWSAEERRRVLTLAIALKGAHDVAWVRAGFWMIQGDVNDGEPRRPLVAVDADALVDRPLVQDWLVQMDGIDDAPLSLGEVQIA